MYSTHGTSELIPTDDATQQGEFFSIAWIVDGFFSMYM